MLGMAQAKNLRAGLLGMALVFAISLCACDEDSESSKKNANKALPETHVFNATVREITGDVRIKQDGDAASLKVGQNFFENTQLTTGVASSVVLSAADGSAFKMDGSSSVLFEVSIESLKRTFSASLHQGRLLFDVQKQAVKDEFEIRTEKISSVVRNAVGFVEYTDGLEVSSLKDGSIDVALTDDSVQPIKNGQTLIANVNGVKVLSLASSGTLVLARAIDSVATEAASELGIHASKLNLEKLEAMLVAFDDAFHHKADSLIKKTQVEFKPKVLSEYIGRPSVTLEALYVPGGIISVQGLVDTIPESGLYKRTFEWADSTAFGPKRFVVNCGNGEVEYICHTWNMNFVSAKMAEVLTKADERKARAVKDTVQQPKILKPTIVIEGSGRERIHVLPEERDIPATLRFSVAGLMGADLKQIKKIVVKRKGSIIKTFSGDELTTNSFKIPLRLKQNRVAHIDVTVYFVKGRSIKARKVYETYCYFENYEGGKKSNRINDMSAEEEYENVVAKHLLKDE